MKHPLRLTGALAALALCLAWLTPAGHGTARADVETHDKLLGQPAPDFEADFALYFASGEPAKKKGKQPKGKKGPKTKEEPVPKEVLKPTKVLERLENRVVLLVFWGMWSGPSRDVLAPLQQWYKEYHPKGLEILAVTVYNNDFNHKVGFNKHTGRFSRIDNPTHATDRQMLKDFAAARKFKFALIKLSKAEAKRVYGLYGVHGIPQLVVIDPARRVRMIRVGSGEENLEDIEGELKRRLKEIQ
jgi:thiol-disulfide isomerase/thioredoxin